MIVKRASRSLLLSAALTRAGFALLRANPPGGAARWQRENYAGRSVGLYAGPAAALGAAGAVVRECPGAGLAVLAAGVCGAYDDVAGDHRRGVPGRLPGLGGGGGAPGGRAWCGVSAA